VNATASTGIQHVFVLVLENRSFDHMLGFSGITGVDAVSGERRSIDGVAGTETNSYQGNAYPVTHPATTQCLPIPAMSFPTCSCSWPVRTRRTRKGARTSDQ
jgi:phospholipase C